MTATAQTFSSQEAIVIDHGTENIPSDWRLTPLGELFEFKNGVNADKKAYGSGIPFANVLDAITRTHLRASDIAGRVTLPRKAIEAYRLQRGDVIFNRTSETQEEVGLTAVYLDTNTVVFGGFVIRGRPKTDQLNPEYAGYGLRSRFIRRQITAMGQGAVHANIGQSDLKKVIVQIPPLSEQQAIAAALSDVDALIGALDKLIAKKRTIKLATMQQLLTGKARLPGFTQPWRDVFLKQFGKTYSGLSGKSREDFGRGNGKYVPFLNVMNNAVLDTDFLEPVSVSSHERQNEIRVGDIFFNGSSETAEEVGMCSALLDEVEHVYLNSFCFGFRFNELADENSLFLAHYFRSGVGRRLLFAEGQGAIRYNLSKTRLLRLPLRIPVKAEQDAIVSVIADMDAEIAALERRRDKTKAIKQGMMQVLLTGKVRLV